MHSIKMMLFFLAFTCLQTVPSHALHTNLQPVVEVSLLAPELPAYSGAAELAEDGWVVYHESAKIKMEYRLAECHDTANDSIFWIHEYGSSFTRSFDDASASTTGTKNRNSGIYAKELKKTDAQPATFKISKIREYEL